MSKDKLIPAMAIVDIAGWLDEEIAFLQNLVKDKGDGVKAVVGFTIEHLQGMKKNLLQTAIDGGKPDA